MIAPPVAPPSRDKVLFRNCVMASAALHGLLWLAANFHFMSPPPADEIEIDLSKPLGTGPAKLGAPKRSSPNAVVQAHPQETPPTPVVPEKVAATPPVPSQDWVLPGAATKILEKPAPALPTPGGTPDGTGTASKVGGSGAGADDGVPGGTGNGGTALKSYPRLLNKDEVLANLRKFYPESERRAGHEATVVVVLHIGVDGSISSTDIRKSGGAAFDAAASKVAQLMRFSPAIGLSGAAVAVRLPQQMVFQLKD